jgi:uncharacterized RDD family membrane protein YckC
MSLNTLDQPQTPQYSGFWRRAAALMIDLILIKAIDLMMVGLGVLAASQALEDLKLSGPSEDLVFLLTGLFILTGLLVFVIYFFYFNLTGQTPGKKLLGLKVISSSPGNLSPAEALARTFGFLISLLTLGLGFFFIFFTRKKQAFHDLLAGTFVVRFDPLKWPAYGSAAAVLLILLTGNPIQVSGTTIDSILVVVDHKIITQSDLRFQSLFALEFPLLDEREDKDAPLQFAIDQALFIEDAAKFGTDPPTESEIADKLNEIQNRIGSDEKLNHLIDREGLTRDDLGTMISRFLLSKKFIDQRITFFVFVRDNEIESYYEDHASKFGGASLDSVKSQIYTLLF